MLLLLLGGGNSVDVGLESVDARSCRRRGGGGVGRREILVFRTTSTTMPVVCCVGVVVSIGRPRPRFGRPGRHLGVKFQCLWGPFSARLFACSSAPAAGMIKSVSFSNVRACKSMGYSGLFLEKKEQKEKGVNVAVGWTGQCGLEDDHQNIVLGLEDVVAEQGSGVGF